MARRIIKYIRKDGCLPNYLWEMAHFHPSSTGLPLTVYLFSNERKLKHGCQIKVGRSGMRVRDCLSIKVPLKNHFDLTFIQKLKKLKISQSEITPITDWIDKNEDIILGYWNNEFCTLALTDKLRERNHWKKKKAT